MNTIFCSLVHHFWLAFSPCVSWPRPLSASPSHSLPVLDNCALASSFPLSVMTHCRPFRLHSSLIIHFIHPLISNMNHKHSYTYICQQTDHTNTHTGTRSHTHTHTHTLPLSYDEIISTVYLQPWLFLIATWPLTVALQQLHKREP